VLEYDTNMIYHGICASRSSLPMLVVLHFSCPYPLAHKNKVFLVPYSSTYRAAPVLECNPGLRLILLWAGIRSNYRILEYKY